MHFRSFAAAVAILAVASGEAQAAAAPPQAATERLLAQEGFAVALASILLQSQFAIIGATVSRQTACSRLPGGGSAKMIDATQKKSTVESVVDLYYDASCTKRFIAAEVDLASTRSLKLPATVTATYAGPTGGRLGTMTLDDTVVISGKAERLAAIGSFVPATGGAAAVSLGLICNIPAGSKTEVAEHCQVGIAQDFPALNLALASITPVQRVVHIAGNTSTVTLAGSGSLLVSAIGGLSVVAASPKKLGIMGTTEANGTARLAGFAAEYGLFPPMPTGWTVTDKAAGARFSIHVASDTLRNWVGNITRTSNRMPLANFAVDQSGTGTINYSDGRRAAITAWMLSD